LIWLWIGMAFVAGIGVGVGSLIVRANWPHFVWKR
jgi:hypothetical protein